MKRLLFLALFTLLPLSAYAQTPPPTMTSASCATSPQYGGSIICYDTTAHGYYYWNVNTNAFTALAGGSPTGAAGGDLGGTYPSPTVVNGSNITNASIPNSGLATPPCANLLADPGQTLYGGATSNNCPQNLADGTAGQIYQSNGASAPSWVNAILTTGGSISGAQSSANLALLWFTPTTGAHLTRFSVAFSTPPATCTGYPAFSVVDCGTSAPSTSGHCSGAATLGTITTTSGAYYIDSGALSAAVAGGHYVEVYTSTVENTCSTHASGAAFTETWTTP